MASLKTTKKAEQALQYVARGEWVKMSGDYHTNAFEAFDSIEEDGYRIPQFHSRYTVSVTKIDDRWFVYAEEHEPQDLFDIEQPREGFATLREAKAAAEEFGASFERLWMECEGYEV